MVKSKSDFFHVPKTAGVSISKALYGRPLGHFYAVNVRMVLPKTFASTFTFGISRHPVDRLYSAYRFARAGSTDEMAIRNPRQYQIKEFNTFDNFVCEWLVNQNLKRIDGVFRPQHFYLCRGKNVIVDRVFRYEEINELENVLSSVLDKDIDIGHSNVSPIYDSKVIDKKTIQVIQEVYHLDYVIFGYV